MVIKTFVPQNPEPSIYGDWFVDEKHSKDKNQVIWFNGGWGKIASAGSTQYDIDKWHPELIINIGTCGGLRIKVKKYQVVLVEETIVYDLINQIG